MQTIFWVFKKKVCSDEKESEYKGEREKLANFFDMLT